MGYAEQKAENRQILTLILIVFVFLVGKASLYVVISRMRRKVRLILMQLLLSIAVYNPLIVKWLKRPQNPEIQNEMLGMMALSILREIRSKVADKINGLLLCWIRLRT
jgi:hypothetical protein